MTRKETFDLGWDLYAHRLKPTITATVLLQGYTAAKERRVGFRRGDRYERKVLSVKQNAIGRGKFVSPDFTADYLRQIDQDSC